MKPARHYTKDTFYFFNFGIDNTKVFACYKSDDNSEYCVDVYTTIRKRKWKNCENLWGEKIHKCFISVKGTSLTKVLKELVSQLKTADLGYYREDFKLIKEEITDNIDAEPPEERGWYPEVYNG